MRQCFNCGALIIVPLNHGPQFAKSGSFPPSGNGINDLRFGEVKGQASNCLRGVALFWLREIRILQVQEVELVPFSREGPLEQLIEAGPCC